jgi:hypothetical protein
LPQCIVESFNVAGFSRLFLKQSLMGETPKTALFRFAHRSMSLAR